MNSSYILSRKMHIASWWWRVCSGGLDVTATMKLLAQYPPNPMGSGTAISLSDLQVWLIQMEDVGGKRTDDPRHQLYLDLQTGEFFAINVHDTDCPDITPAEKAEHEDPDGCCRPVVTLMENRENRVRVWRQRERYVEIPIVGHETWRQWFLEFQKSRGLSYEYLGDPLGMEDISERDVGVERVDGKMG